jgi:hypothetical protein
MTTTQQIPHRYHTQNSPQENLERVQFGEKLDDLFNEGTDASLALFYRLCLNAKDKKGKQISKNKLDGQRVVSRMFGSKSMFKHCQDSSMLLSWKTLESLSMVTRDFSHRVRVTDLVLYGIGNYANDKPLPRYALSPKSEPVCALISNDKEFYADICILHAKSLQERGEKLSERDELLAAHPTPNLSPKAIMERAQRATHTRSTMYNSSWVEGIEESLSSNAEDGKDGHEVAQDEDVEEAGYTVEEYMEVNEYSSNGFIEVQVPENEIEVEGSIETEVEKESIAARGRYSVEELYSKVDYLTESIRSFGDMITAKNAFLGQQDIIDALKARLETETLRANAEYARAEIAEEKIRRITAYFEDIIVTTALLREGAEGVKSVISVEIPAEE